MPEEINRIPEEQKLSLESLIDLKSWQKIQDNFSALTGVGLRLVDEIGVTVTSPSGEPRLCSDLFKDQALKNKLCGSCLPTFLGGRAILNKNLVFVCEMAGLHNFATPIEVDSGKVLGYMIVGPVVLIALKAKEEYRNIAEELGIDLEEFWDAIVEVKAMSFRGIQSLVELIKDIAEFNLKSAYYKTVKAQRKDLASDQAKLARLLDSLLDVAFEISGANVGSIMLFNKTKSELTIHTSKGISPEIVRNTRVKLGSGISGMVAKSGESFLIDNNTRDNRIKPYLNRPNVASSMVLPLKIEERIMGVMNLGSLETSTVRFGEDNMLLMHKLVDLATVSI
jgi:ligand-binding sensor protein